MKTEPKKFKSRITTEEQLMKLAPNTDVYIYNSSIHDITFWKVLGRIPYNTMEILCLYRGADMTQISKHQLNRMIFLNHDEAYQFLADELRRQADSVERIHLKIEAPKKEEISSKSINLAKKLLKHMANGPVPCELKQSAAFHLLQIIEFLQSKVEHEKETR